jgi:site-specific recombinase XerC
MARRNPRTRRPGHRLRYSGARAGHAARLPLRLAPVRRLVHPPRAAGTERRSLSGRHVPDRRGRAPRRAVARPGPSQHRPAAGRHPLAQGYPPGPAGDADLARDAVPQMVCAQPDSPLGLRNRAILLTGFGEALRRSEIVALNGGNLEFVDDRGVVLTVRRSKTDQHGAGQAIAIWRSDDPDLCAPTALRRWLEHRAARHADDSLFVGLCAGGMMTGTRLSDKAVVRLVKDTAEAIGGGDPGLMERTSGNIP